MTTKHILTLCGGEYAPETGPLAGNTLVLREYGVAEEHAPGRGLVYEWQLIAAPEQLFETEGSPDTFRIHEASRARRLDEDWHACWHVVCPQS